MAPGGTTVLAPPGVGTDPVTWRLWGVGEVNGPSRPMPTPARVSRMRSGVMATKRDAGDPDALTMVSPPAPRVTATAAPMAAQRVRSRLDRGSALASGVLVVVAVMPTILRRFV